MEFLRLQEPFDIMVRVSACANSGIIFSRSFKYFTVKYLCREKRLTLQQICFIFLLSRVTLNCWHIHCTKVHNHVTLH